MNTISEHFGTRLFKISVEQKGKKKKSIDGCDDITQPNETWPRLVNEYTRCNLTNPEEGTLAPLAGIARQYSVLHNDKYCVGACGCLNLFGRSFGMLKVKKTGNPHFINPQQRLIPLGVGPVSSVKSG